jgi:two-component system, OmpR family, alkaline phosphatase synthesis response regulator PhoP
VDCSKHSLTTPDPTLRLAGHTVDLSARKVVLSDGKRRHLSARQAKLLQLLASQEGKVVHRDDILDAVWGRDAFPSSRTVDNAVLRLRQLLEPRPSRPVHLHTVRGAGYRLTLEPEPAGE